MSRPTGVTMRARTESVRMGPYDVVNRVTGDLRPDPWRT